MASDGAAGDMFGLRLSILGNVLAVGAQFDESGAVLSASIRSNRVLVNKSLINYLWIRFSVRFYHLKRWRNVE